MISRGLRITADNFREAQMVERTQLHGGTSATQADAVYRVVDVIGVSATSWEDAARNAIETAASSLRDLRIAEITKMDVKVDNGKLVAFRTRLSLSFKYEH
jgi:dodecin